MTYEQLPSLLTIKEVAVITRRKYSAASKVVKELNDLLEADGYFTIQGRVSKDFLFQKFNLDRTGFTMRIEDLDADN